MDAARLRDKLAAPDVVTLLTDGPPEQMTHLQVRTAVVGGGGGAAGLGVYVHGSLGPIGRSVVTAGVGGWGGGVQGAGGGASRSSPRQRASTRHPHASARVRAQMWRQAAVDRGDQRRSLDRAMEPAPSSPRKAQLGALEAMQAHSPLVAAAPAAVQQQQQAWAGTLQPARPRSSPPQRPPGGGGAGGRTRRPSAGALPPPPQLFAGPAAAYSAVLAGTLMPGGSPPRGGQTPWACASSLGRPAIAGAAGGPITKTVRFDAGTAPPGPPPLSPAARVIQSVIGSAIGIGHGMGLPPGQGQGGPVAPPPRSPYTLSGPGAMRSILDRTGTSAAARRGGAGAGGEGGAAAGRQRRRSLSLASSREGTTSTSTGGASAHANAGGLPRPASPPPRSGLITVARPSGWQERETRLWLAGLGLEVAPHEETAPFLQNPYRCVPVARPR
jgi:hypothetical protein